MALILERHFLSGLRLASPEISKNRSDLHIWLIFSPDRQDLLAYDKYAILLNLVSSSNCFAFFFFFVRALMPLATPC